MTSFSSCGMGIAFISFVTCHCFVVSMAASSLSEFKLPQAPDHAFCAVSLLGHTTGTARDPELDESGHTGNGQKSGRGEQPASKTSSC